jgi:hypothetical protein
LVAADTRNNGLTAAEPEYYRLRMNNAAPPRAAVALFGRRSTRRLWRDG